MAKGKKVYFPFYFSFRDTAQTMPPRLRAAFYEAIIEYGTTGIEPTLPKSISGYWPLVKPAIDTSSERFDAGKKGGEASVKSRFGSNKEKEKEKEKEKDNEKEKEKEKDSNAATAASAPDTEPFDIFADFANGDEELLKALRDYNQMRREKHKSLTQTMRRSLCQQLDEEFQPCEWVEIIKQATRQGWLKFYPLDKDTPTNTPTTDDNGKAQLDRILNNLKNMNRGNQL